jgi:hypothetical protein
MLISAEATLLIMLTVLISAEANLGCLTSPPILLIVAYGADKYQGQPFLLSIPFDCCFLLLRPLHHRANASLLSSLIVAFLRQGHQAIAPMPITLIHIQPHIYVNGSGSLGTFQSTLPSFPEGRLRRISFARHY